MCRGFPVRYRYGFLSLLESPDVLANARWFSYPRYAPLYWPARVLKKGNIQEESRLLYGAHSMIAIVYSFFRIVHIGDGALCAVGFECHTLIARSELGNNYVVRSSVANAEPYLTLESNVNKVNLSYP